MIIVYPFILMLKWYAEDFVICASNVSLQSCKLYSSTKFVKIITVSLVCNWNLHVFVRMITVEDVRSDLVQMQSNRKAQSSTGKVNGMRLRTRSFFSPADIEASAALENTPLVLRVGNLPFRSAK